MLHACLRRMENFQVKNFLCSRFQLYLMLLLFYGQLFTTSVFKGNIVKELPLDVTNLLPGWTYYSIDGGKFTIPEIVLSKNNMLMAVHTLSCKRTYKLHIDTLKILNEETYLKSKYLIKLTRKCNTNSINSVLTSLPEHSDLYTSFPWSTKVVDISQIFPEQYTPMQIHCDDASSTVFLTNEGGLRLDKNLMKNRAARFIECTVYIKNEFDKQKLGLTLSFPTPILSRERRSSSIKFDKDPFYVKVKESVNIGYVILTLNAKGGSGTYLYSKNNDIKSDRLFLMVPNTGDLKVREKLNREDGVTRYTIDVTAVDKTDSSLVGRTSVVITILDTNDNAPIFTQQKYEKTVPEEQQPRFILTVAATDADDGINKEIEYSIVKDSENLYCPFKIDKTSGVISNTEVLDRETKSYYVLKVEARDKGVDPGSLSSMALVNITLSDVNDNGPIFEKQKYNISIPENTPINAVILTVRSTDKDSGTNSLVQYQPLGIKAFTIDSVTGEIKLNEIVDYDRFQQLFEFTVVAFDRGSPPKYASVPVTVKITDVNDNPPVFTRRVFKVNRPVLENLKIGTQILKLSARDTDSGSFGKITYSFSAEPNDLPFSLDKDNGEISLKKTLDYEIQKVYKFSVKATDGGFPAKSDEATVVIEVDNVNDNAPRFKSASYKLDISEDTRKGSPIFTVTAEDPDQLSSLSFEFSIVEGDPDGCFSIDPFSGVIRLGNCNLDFKKQKIYNLKLKVIDEDGKSGYSYFQIVIYDANNNSPKFDKSVNLLYVKEDVPIGSSVGFVTAADDDDGENARITYSLQVPDDVFQLNSSTGEITTKKLLNREEKLSYQFSIKGQDHGKPSPKSSTTTVIVTVVDVNDNAPKFKKSSYEFIFKEDVAVGYVVGAVAAYDEDDGMNKEIRYSLAADGDNSFSIDADSAIIKTKKLLDREKTESYTLVVVATDQGFDKKLSSSIEVLIKLDDVQDSPPVFEHKVYRFSLDENANVQVGKVKATLADEKYKDTLTYSISKNYLDLFRIDRHRGTILIKEPLDYETRSNYTLEIRVSVDSGLTDKTTVIVLVNDVNDYPPVLEDFYIFLNIYSSGKINPVFKVPASDADVTSVLQYNILSGNEHDFVSLNQSTGELRLLKSIMNIATEVAIKFEVHDGLFTANAVGRIALSEVTGEMITNSMFIVLYNTTKYMFLRANILKKFKTALANAFSCDSGRIFILSIEKFEHHLADTDDIPKLEVAIAVREDKKDNFLPTLQLKNLLYFNQKSFESILGMDILYMDFYNDFWCGAEICHNFQPCLIEVNETSAITEDNTIESRYVIFRGIKIKIKSQDKDTFCQACPESKGYRDGPDELSKCTDHFSLCYSKPCEDHGKCFSTDEGSTCQCYSGYSGENCAINKRTDTCPGTNPFSRKRNPCHNDGECINNENRKGFRCKCDSAEEFDGDSCTLSARHFPKDSYISLPALTQRWNVTISMEFVTYNSNAVLLYNGRYNNKKDFLTLEIVDGQVRLTVSLGGRDDKIHTVTSFIPGGVNDGEWHLLKARYNQKLLTIAVGSDCDINIAHLVNPEGKHSYCSASKSVTDSMKSLDLTAPLHIGGLPAIGRRFQTSTSDFVGCIRNIFIDYEKKDLSNPLKNHLTTAKCQAMKTDCQNSNPCNAGSCFNALYGLICKCPEHRMGRYCEIDISENSPVVSLNTDSQIVIKKIESPIIVKTSIHVKTTQKNATIWQQVINNKRAYLKISHGYPCFIFDSTVLMNLTSLYVSDGRWHQLQVSYQDSKMMLSGDYQRFSMQATFFLKITSCTLVGIGGNETFIGCLKGLLHDDKMISMVSRSNKNVDIGCGNENVCPASEDTCGKHGNCKVTYGTSQCVCAGAHKGPQCIDMCAQNPCQNNGVCINDEMKLSGFKCSCLVNFTGEYCETSISSECKDGQYNKGLGCGICTCKTSENFDPVCDKYGKAEKNSFPGKCFCKDTFYNSQGTCMPCDCLEEGTNSFICDKLTGKCPCKGKAIGRKCDRCPGAWEELASQCNEINISCPRTWTLGILWNRVPPGSTQRTNCPTGAIGNATRYCHERNSWLSPNLFGCTSIGFLNVKRTIIDNPVLTQMVARNLADQLEYAAVSSQSLYGKDIEIGYESLKMLIAYEGNHTGEDLVSSDDKYFVSNIVYSASALFTPSVKEFWDMIQEKYAGTAGLMKEMEKFLEILSTNLAFVKRRRYRRSEVTTLLPYSYAAENMYLEVQPINVNEDVDTYTFPREQLDWSEKYSVWNTETVKIILNKALFDDNVNVLAGQISIGMVIYKTLGKLLPSQYDITDRQKGRAYDIDVYSDVFTLTVPGVDRIPTDKEITIVYKNAKTNRSGVSLTCVFWNYTLSDTISGGWSRNGCETFIDNTTDVTCLCNHLTSFALIGIRYTEIIEHTYKPTILTYIAVIVCIALTFLVFLIYMCLRQLKSNANSIHKNLSLVAFMSWLLFILLVNRPELGENYCRLISIGIHYSITCAFSWLFVEALHMYRMILEPRDINYGQMMFYYFIGWGAPLMVVGVTAGLKPEGYGNKKFCWISIKDYNEIMWVYLAPILAIIATNIIVVFVAAVASCNKQNSKKKQMKVATIRYRLAISMLFLPLLGATVFSALVTVSYEDHLFMYIFPGLCVLEGLYLLLFYVVFNKKVRREAKNAYIRWKTGDKTYGIKPSRKRQRAGASTNKDRQNLLREKYRPMLQAFHLPTSSTTDSSDTDAKRRARVRMAGSDTTDFLTTNPESSDSSDDDSVGRSRRPTIDSDTDSSDNSSGPELDQSVTSNGKHTPGKVEWKQATHKKLINKRTYASDGPMHSTPSESDTSGDRLKWKKAGFTPTKVNGYELSAIQSESDQTTTEDGMKFATRPGTRINTKVPSSSNTDSDDKPKDKTPVSILKKKSSYDGRGKMRAVRVNKKDSSKKPLMSLDDTAEFNDSQV